MTEKTSKNHSFQAEVSKLLDLVANSLYSEREIFLRELISNSADACEKLRYQSLSKKNILGDDKDLKINVRVSKKKKFIEIQDNGIGMSEQELIEENKRLKKDSNKTGSKKIIVLSETHAIDDWKLIVEQVEIENTKDLRNLVDDHKNSNEKICAIIFSVKNNKVALVCGVTSNLTDSISAKDVVSKLSSDINGSGGGRADFSQGAGETENVREFVTSIPNSVKSLAK